MPDAPIRVTLYHERRELLALYFRKSRVVDGSINVGSASFEEPQFDVSLDHQYRSLPNRHRMALIHAHRLRSLDNESTISQGWYFDLAIWPRLS